ncbi:MAG: hypothetical protein ACOVVK_03190 [Elsteraceae bacterium]
MTRALLILALLAPLALAACAKKGEPNPPEGAPSTYPRKYPAP